MSALDQLLRDALGGQAAASEPQSANLLEGVLEMLSAQGGGQARSGGGLQLLAQLFQQQGLGDVLSSWIGSGQNRAISADELGRVFGAEPTSRISQRAGVSPSQGLGLLAQMLPLVIDRLTPQGQVPQRDPLLELRSRQLGQPGGAGGTSMVGDKPKPDFSNVRSGSSSTAPPPAPPAVKTYTVVAGDSLSKIAKKFYGDASKWKRIFESNKDQIKNHDLIKPGQTFKIPD
jgi:uncharacterized protein YidB (DUF937 family)